MSAQDPYVYHSGNQQTDCRRITKREPNRDTDNRIVSVTYYFDGAETLPKAVKQEAGARVQGVTQSEGHNVITVNPDVAARIDEKLRALGNPAAPKEKQAEG